jgi:hypothetical protein
VPATGAAAAAAPGGTAFSSQSTGALPLLDVDEGAGEENYFVGGWISSVNVADNVILYDRLFGVEKTMSSSAAQSVTGVPTRYTDTTMGGVGNGECFGNFIFVETKTTLSATAHNWTVCRYINQDGSTVKTLTSMAGVSGSTTGAMDMDIAGWYWPLTDSDFGVYAIEQIQCSSAAVTGGIEFVLGHPIAFMPCPIVNLIIPINAIQGAFQLERIRNQACLSFLSYGRAQTGSNNVRGAIRTVGT